MGELQMSWYSPEPVRAPPRSPRRQPIKTVPSGIGDQDIVANYLFYRLKGGDHLHDFSPEKNHGTINGGAKWKDGQYGWALNLDGTDDVINIPADPSLSDYNAFTICMWIKPTLVSGESQPAFNKSSWNTYGRLGGDGSVYFIIKNTAGDSSVITNLEGGTPVRDGKWNHIVFLADVNKDLQADYVNGELDYSQSIAWTGDLQFGVDDSIELGLGPNGYCTGVIGITRIYIGVAKSSSWISKRYERTKGIFRS